MQMHLAEKYLGTFFESDIKNKIVLTTQKDYYIKMFM